MKENNWERKRERKKLINRQEEGKPQKGKETILARGEESDQLRKRKKGKRVTEPIRERGIRVHEKEGGRETVWLNEDNSQRDIDRLGDAKRERLCKESETHLLGDMG